MKIALSIIENKIPSFSFTLIRSISFCSCTSVKIDLVMSAHCFFLSNSEIKINKGKADGI